MYNNTPNLHLSHMWEILNMHLVSDQSQESEEADFVAVLGVLCKGKKLRSSRGT